MRGDAGEVGDSEGTPEGADVLGPASVGSTPRADFSPLHEGPVWTRRVDLGQHAGQCLTLSSGHPPRWPCCH